MAAMLRLGFGRNVMRGHDRQARLESIYKYANEETFYRTPGEVARAFAAAGLTVDRGVGARVLLRSRLPRWRALVPVVAPLVNLMRTTVVAAHKPPGKA